MRIKRDRKFGASKSVTASLRGLYGLIIILLTATQLSVTQADPGQPSAKSVTASNNHRAQKPTALTPIIPNPEQPDVQILIVRLPNGADMVGLTYPGLIAKAQALRDVTNISQSFDSRLEEVQISNSSLPLAGMTAIPMTSTTFETTGILPSTNQNTIRIEPMILGLKSYKTLTITYIMPKGYVFKGLNDYSDQFVNIKMIPRNGLYNYKVRILNSTFDRLNLPLTQPSPAEIKVVTVPTQKKTLQQTFEVMLVSILAVGVGYSVYMLLSKVH